MSIQDDLLAAEQALQAAIDAEQRSTGTTIGDLFAQVEALRAQVMAQQGYSPPADTLPIGSGPGGATS